MNSTTLLFDQQIEAPYPGLRPFEPHEAKIFFGRAEQISDMLLRLDSERFLAVVGASGSGKSSLVRAGLLPALNKGYLLSASPCWHMVLTRPGNTPYTNLAASLHAALSRDQGIDHAHHSASFIETVLRSGPMGLVQAVCDAGWKSDTDSSVLVLVDQFEELFRFRHHSHPHTHDDQQDQQAADAQRESSAFVDMLLHTVRQTKRRIYVVITMRSDFLGGCDAFLGLPQAINDSQFLTPRMDRGQCQQAIQRPLKLFDQQVTPELVNSVLNDLGSQRDQLPLIQHALMRTWQLG